MRILHVITTLDIGGAEMQLYRLLGKWKDLTSTVVVLAGPGQLGESIEALGVPVVPLFMRRSPADVTRVWSLRRVVRRFRPDVVHTWMGHANLLAALALIGVRQPGLVWSIHRSSLDAMKLSLPTSAVEKLAAMLSRRPDAVVSTSEETIPALVREGYDPAKIVHIANAVDTDRFRPDASAREKLRRELGVSADTPLIGLVARYDPQKDHATFARAGRRILEARADVHLVLAGRGVDDSNTELLQSIGGSGTGARVHLLGERMDTEVITPALDVACLSSSYGETTPLALLEAMASGVPCVVTDVGDCRRIVGAHGRVVPPGEPMALAEACLEVLALPRDRLDLLRTGAREHVIAGYGVERCASAYVDLYEEVLAARRPT